MSENKHHTMASCARTSEIYTGEQKWESEGECQSGVDVSEAGEEEGRGLRKVV